MLVTIVRKDAGRKSIPSYGLIDSQSAKTTSASVDSGFDGGKKVNDRKHHIVIDTMGNLLAISVHAANVHDTKSGINPATKAYEKCSTLEKFCGDEGYSKLFEVVVAEQLGLGVNISKRLKPEFEVLPLR